MSSNFATIEQELRKQPELYQKTHLFSISFDPTYDTPKVLRSYGAAYTGGIQTRISRTGSLLPAPLTR